jgi:integrase
MFDQLFTRPHARGRHVNSPLLKERLDYLRHCTEQSYKPGTLRELAQNLLRIQNLLGLATSSNAIDPATIEVAVKRTFRSRISDGRRKQIVSVAIHWLGFLKRLRLPPVATPIYQPLKQDFVDYLREEKGLAAGTLRTRGGSVEDFLQWFFRNHKSLHVITIADVDEAITRKGRDERYTRRSIQRYASDLRTFVRYAESKGWCSQGLAAGIVSPRVYRGESLPRGLFWNDVQRLIASTEADRPLDVRDRAILLLLAVYGLRSIEVRNLKLDDVDWQIFFSSLARRDEERNLILSLQRLGRPSPATLSVYALVPRIERSS